MSEQCAQEMCPNWDGFGCPCEVLDIDKPESRRCPECGDHRGWWVGPDWNTGEAAQIQCRTCAEHECPTLPGSSAQPDEGES